jgi:hypothetical protein
VIVVDSKDTSSLLAEGDALGSRSTCGGCAQSCLLFFRYADGIFVHRKGMMRERREKKEEKEHAIQRGIGDGIGFL